MKRIWIAFVLLPCLAAPSLAEFEAGRDAYIRGDFTLAYQEFLSPANEGDSKSRIGLGLLHARGQGVPRNLVQAHKWFDLAASQNAVQHPVIRILAKTNRDYIAKRMSPKQIAESKIQAAMISPTYKGPRKARAGGATVHDGTRLPFTVHRTGLTSAGKTDSNGPSIIDDGPAEPDRVRSVIKSKAAQPVRIQLTALREGKATEALTAWALLTRRHDVLFGLAPTVSRVDLGEKGTFHRLRAGPFSSQADAREVCDALRAARQDCFVVAN